MGLGGWSPFSLCPSSAWRLGHRLWDGREQGGASREEGSIGGAQPAWGLGKRGQQEPSVATIHACHLMPVRSWAPRSCWAGPGLTSPSRVPAPWALSQAMPGEGCSPVASPDLSISRAHGQFRCLGLPSAHACPSPMRAAIESAVSLLSTKHSFPKAAFQGGVPNAGSSHEAECRADRGTLGGPFEHSPPSAWPSPSPSVPSAPTRLGLPRPRSPGRLPLTAWTSIKPRSHPWPRASSPPGPWHQL